MLLSLSMLCMMDGWMDGFKLGVGCDIVWTAQVGLYRYLDCNMLGFGRIPVGSLDRVGGGTLSVFVLFQVVILKISSFLQTLKVKNPSSINQSMHNLESRFHAPVELILSPEIDMRALISDDEDSCQEKASQPRFVFDEISVVFFHMSINTYLVDKSVDSFMLYTHTLPTPR